MCDGNVRYWGCHGRVCTISRAEERPENVHLMRLLDEQYTATPFYGVRRMTAWLRRQGSPVNHKRVARLMQQMGIAAIYTKPKLSQATAGHTIYPYLLRGVKVARVQSRLEYRYHVYPFAPGFCLPGGGDGLVQSVCTELGALGDAGWAVLS